jgi:hypothetical protein
MSKSKEYLIPFIGLKLGKHHFEYQISNALKSLIIMNMKKFRHFRENTMLEVSFKHKGSIYVPCNYEDFDLPIKGKMNLIVVLVKSTMMIMNNYSFSLW